MFTVLNEGLSMGTVTLKTTDLVDRIVELCDATSQRSVAEELGVSPSTITNWRRGTKMELTWDLLVKSSKVLGVRIPEVVELHYGRKLPDDVATEAMIKAIGDADTLGDPSGPYQRLLSAVFADAEEPEADDNVLDLDAHGEVIDASDRFSQAPPPEPEDGAAAAGVAA